MDVSGILAKVLLLLLLEVERRAEALDAKHLPAIAQESFSPSG
jgi:hypothetical protein